MFTSVQQLSSSNGHIQRHTPTLQHLLKTIHYSIAKLFTALFDADIRPSDNTHACSVVVHFTLRLRI